MLDDAVLILELALAFCKVLLFLNYTHPNEPQDFD